MEHLYASIEKKVAKIKQVVRISIGIPRIMQIRDYLEIELIRISCYFTFGTIFGTTFGARKLFSKKHTHAEVVIIQPLLHAIYAISLYHCECLNNKVHRLAINRRQMCYSGRQACRQLVVPSAQSSYLVQWGERLVASEME